MLVMVHGMELRAIYLAVATRVPYRLVVLSSFVRMRDCCVLVPRACVGYFTWQGMGVLQCMRYKSTVPQLSVTFISLIKDVAEVLP